MDAFNYDRPGYILGGVKKIMSDIDVIERIRSPRLREQMDNILDVLQEVQGKIYYVEGNAGLDTNDGLSWETAFKTLAVALAASHANIAAGKWGWAARNTIYCKGDALTEDLVLLADKTDVIGVGSCNANPYCRLTGNHVIPASSGMGCHFYNMEFWGAGGIIFKNTSNGGLEFHNCRFVANAAETIGLQLVSPDYVKVEGCKFLPKWNTGAMFSTAAIDITVGNATECEIVDNLIYGSVGIAIYNSTFYACSLRGNTIYATTLCLDENSDDWLVVNNRFVTAATKANGFDCELPLMCGNIITGSDGTRTLPFAVIA